MFTDPFVIAEIGSNHMGDLNICKHLFREAKHCGADAVKLQKRDNKTLYTKKFYNKPYDNPNSFGATYGEHREVLEFGEYEYRSLKDYAEELDIIFFSTPFDIPSADFLERLDMPLYKIASADCNNIPLIKHVAEFGKPMVISTGASNTTDINRFFEILRPRPWNENNIELAILHCVASYPNQPEEMNLNVIPELVKKYPKAVIGLSDHYNGIHMATGACMLGAKVFEKHFTLNHSWKGTDHAFSLEPQGLESMIRIIHEYKIALGNSEKKMLPSEKAPIEKMGKSVWPTRKIARDTKITDDMICIKTPAGGMPPYDAETIVGQTLLNDASTAAPFTWGDFST